MLVVAFAFPCVLAFAVPFAIAVPPPQVFERPGSVLVPLTAVELRHAREHAPRRTVERREGRRHVEAPHSTRQVVCLDVRDDEEHRRAERVHVRGRGGLPRELLGRGVARRSDDRHAGPLPLGRRHGVEVDEHGRVVCVGAKHDVRRLDVAVDHGRHARLQVDEEVEQRFEQAPHVVGREASVALEDSLLERTAVEAVPDEHEPPRVVLLEGMHFRQRRVRQPHEDVGAALEEVAEEPVRRGAEREQLDGDALSGGLAHSLVDAPHPAAAQQLRDAEVPAHHARRPARTARHVVRPDRRLAARARDGAGLVQARHRPFAEYSTTRSAAGPVGDLLLGFRACYWRTPVDDRIATSDVHTSVFVSPLTQV